MPGSLRVGTIWGDSGSYVTCRDGVRMRASVRRTFRVAAATERNGRASLAIVRLSRTLLEGEGAQAGEPVSITGSGSGELSYLLDAGVGEIVSALGTSTLELTLRSKLRTQLVRQSGEIRIARNR